VLGLFADWHPAFDSLGHFRLHLGVLLICVACALALLSFCLHGAIAFLLGIGAIGTTLAPGAIPGLAPVHAAQPLETNQPIYTLLQVNLRFDNATPEKVLSMIARAKPDVIAMQEVSAMWGEKLELLRGAYPYQVNCRRRKFGVAIVSRRPFQLGSEPQCFERGSLAIASVNFRGSIADVAALHLAWPWPFEQDWHLGNLAGPLGGLGDTAILGGDFNAATWSAATRRVAAMAALQTVHGVGASWLPFGVPRWLRPAGLPIDQIMKKGGVEIRSVRRLQPLGSDHWPVLVEFSLRQGDPDAPPSVTVGLKMQPEAG